jgi:hypothetical protein
MEGSKLNIGNVYVHLNKSLYSITTFIDFNSYLDIHSIKLCFHSKKPIKKERNTLLISLFSLKYWTKINKIPRKFLSNVNIKEMILELFLKNTIICRFFNKKGVF